MIYYENLKNALNWFGTEKLWLSLMLFLVVICIQYILARWIERWKIKSETKRKWRVTLRNLISLLFVFLLFLTWSTEIKTFALSLVAIAAAVAISVKEFILCFMGGVYKGASGLFKVGDCIEIRSFRGDVLDHNLLSTRLKEVGPGKNFHQYTGREVVFPNSLFLSDTVVNEGRSDSFVLHTFSVFFKLTPDFAVIEARLKAIAKDVCFPFHQESELYFSKMSRVQMFDEPAHKIKVSVNIPRVSEVEYVVRIPTPIDQRGPIEQKIKKRFLNEIASYL